MKKWLKRLAAGIAALAICASAVIYVGSLRRLGKSYDIALKNFDVTRFQFTPQEAQRRATTFMCTGCHGVAGNVIFDSKAVATLVAPNLSRVAMSYTDSQLERLLRHGVKKDGTGVIAMPSANYAHLADEDVAAVITWLRSLEQRPDAKPDRTSWGPLGRLALATGKIPYDADRIPATTPPWQRPAEFGAYFVRVTCTHCHEIDRQRDDGFGMITPALGPVMKAYDDRDFDHLIDTGKGIGERDLGIMSSVAREEFSQLSEGERKALHDYLVSLGE